jgi:hypothetical protein
MKLSSSDLQLHKGSLAMVALPYDWMELNQTDALGFQNECQQMFRVFEGYHKTSSFLCHFTSAMKYQALS